MLLWGRFNIIQIDSVTGWCGYVGHGAGLSKDLTKAGGKEEYIQFNVIMKRKKYEF